MVDADEAIKFACEQIEKHVGLVVVGPLCVRTVIEALNEVGWVCVPRDATQEMLEAVPHTANSNHHLAQKVREAVMTNFADDYKRAIAAAPRLTGAKR